MNDAIIRKISNTLTGRKVSEEHRQKNIRHLRSPKIQRAAAESLKSKKSGVFSEEVRHKAHIRASSLDSNQKRKSTMAKNNHQQKEKNSQFGTKWITNGISNAKLKTDEELPIGWKFGRCIIGADGGD